ncbi:MAG: toll/interleukin-1 receptor domain-containing protein [Hyphomicrobiales bacterium]|nr:toll/interleukin-1 receptor domain-containing protein [Hyphomicrobiales bacterium]
MHGRSFLWRGSEAACLAEIVAWGKPAIVERQPTSPSRIVHFLSPGLLPQRTIGLDKPPHVDIMLLRDFFGESGLTQVAYLGPHFDPDVFVSYAHGDPRHVGESPLKTWTIALVRRLESQILSLDTEYDALQIWMDEQIDPTAQLTEELRSKAVGSGILVIVMSKRYLVSSWCRDELEWFRKQIQERAGELGRVFVIRAQPTDQAAWPDFLRDERGYAMPGFSFYDPATGLPWGWPDLVETDRDLVKEMCRLQTALTKRLRELRDRAEKRSQAEAAAKPATTSQPGAPQSGAHRIYLHAPADCEPARVEIGRVLTQDGLVTLTARVSVEGGLASWQQESGARIETAKRCEALALLRPHDPDRFVGDLIDIGVDERARIADARGAPLPCAVLDNTGASMPIDVAPFGIEHFDVSRENWRGEFRRWLDAARPKRAEASA